MITLLHRAVQHDVLPAYARKLLAASSPYNPIARDAVGPGSDRLIEPLSERECEVLRMVAEGLSNNEIAARLYLSLSTVKFHTGNIYSKLGVKNRTEAVARARSLGLLLS